MKLWYENHDMRGLSLVSPITNLQVIQLWMCPPYFHGFVKAENENDLKEFDHHGISSSDTR